AVLSLDLLHKFQRILFTYTYHSKTDNDLSGAEALLDTYIQQVVTACVTTLNKAHETRAKKTTRNFSDSRFPSPTNSSMGDSNKHVIRHHLRQHRQITPVQEETLIHRSNPSTARIATMAPLNGPLVADKLPHGRSDCCSKCGQSFHNKTCLKWHMVSHRNKTARCEVCSEEFPDGRSFMNNRSHTESRQFPCHECGKTFGSRSSQQIHLRVHSGDRP
ncbi:hypothetical protein quinque_016457, partial [Culex quinquefasciatus]